METRDLWVAFRTLFSAGTYLFSLGTITYAMVAFCKEYIKYRDLCHGPCPNFSCGDRSYNCIRADDSRTDLIIAFSKLFFAHTVNAFMFAFKFDKGDAPLISAYFLPLMQLWRLLNLFKESWSCKGFVDFQLEEKNSLFTQLSLSLETFPLYAVQIIAWCYRLTHYLHGSFMLHAVKGNLISTASSFMSSMFIGGLLIQAASKNAKSFKMKAAIAVSSGLFISASAYLRIASLITLYYNTAIEDRIKIYEGEGISLNILHTHMIDVLISSIKVIIYFLLYMIFLSSNKVNRLPVHTRLVKAFALAYISIILGPLYPLVSEALGQEQLGTWHFRIKLVTVALIHIAADYIVTAFARQFVPQADIIAVAVVYVISMAVYVFIDKQCGKRDASYEQNLTVSMVEEVDIEQRSEWPWLSGLGTLWVPLPILYPIKTKSKKPRPPYLLGLYNFC